MMFKLKQRASRSKGLLLVGLAAACLATMIAMIAPSAWAAQPYDNGAYGDCAYSQGCDPAKPPTVVTVPPTANNPQSGRAFAVNITEGQIFDKGRYTVIITPNFSTEQIAKVEFYQGSQLIGSTDQAKNGAYSIDWRLPKDGSYQVRAVLYLTDGSKIEKTLSVLVNRQKAAVPSQSQSSNSQPADSTSKLFKKLPGWLQNLALNTPRQLAYAMPYILLSLLAGLLLTFLYQIRNQLQYIAVLLKLIERDKQLIDEKANFIMLASHYVRTPLTVLAGTIELSQADNPSDVALAKAKTVVDNFHAKAEQILSDVEQNKDLNAISEPNLDLARRRLYRSFSLLGPIIISLLLMIGINGLYMAAQKIHLVVPNLVLQFILFALISSLFYALFKRHAQQKEERMKLAQQAKYELALDQARNRFIERSAAELTPLAQQLRTSFEKTASLASSAQITDALGKLDRLIERFVMVTRLERGKIEKSINQFNVSGIIKKVTDSYQSNIKAKNQTLTLQLRPIGMQQSQSLFEHVLNVLIDNAVKFTPDSESINVVATSKGKKRVLIKVDNSGVGITDDKLDRLFKPFSRLDDAEVFNEGGAGLSLYLARLIMRYLEGNITLQSIDQSTSAQINLPKKIS